MHLTPGIIDEHSHIAIERGVNEATQASSAEVWIGHSLNSEDVKQSLASDYARAKLKGLPAYEQTNIKPKEKKQGIANKRQLSHQ